MKQAFRLFGNYGTIKVEIDRALATDTLLHQINNFWSGAEDRLNEASGDVLLASLRNLYVSVAAVCIYRDISSPEEMIEHFKEREEGWPPLDGTDGIKLVVLDIGIDEPECGQVEEIRP